MVLAQISTAAGGIDTLKQRYRVFKTCESKCTKAFDDCQKISDEHTKTCDWISDNRPENAYTNMYECIELDKYPNCGQWLLDMAEYKDWDFGHSDILWIEGTGKQYIPTFWFGTNYFSWNRENVINVSRPTDASQHDHAKKLRTRIIQQHREMSYIHRDRRLAYFYCTKDYGNQSTKTILKAILRQVVCNPVDRAIAQKARDMYNVRDRPPLESLKQCEDLLVDILEAGVKLRIVIDALDETSDWRDLLNVLRRVYNKVLIPNQFQLLVSGRAEVNVEAKFGNAVKVHVSHVRTETEMREYITRSIDTCPKDERPVQGACPELEQRLIDILCKKANGM
jgi:hypothetical protein